MQKSGPVRFTAMLLAAALMPLGSGAQTVKDSVKTLKKSIVDKQFYLWSFSADRNIYWQWGQGKLLLLKPNVRAISVFTPQWVSLKNDVLEIDGTRQILVRDKDGPSKLSRIADGVSIYIDLRGSDVAEQLALIPSMLFFKGQDDALAHLPKDYPGPMHLILHKGTDENTLSDLDCSRVGADTLASNQSIRYPGVEPPKAISWVHAQVPDEAVRNSVNGAVAIAFTVDTTGKPADFWLMESYGYGMDQEQVRAIGQTHFSPATCHGKPFAATLEMGMSTETH